MKVQYITDDNKVFLDRDEALRHEVELKNDLSKKIIQGKRVNFSDGYYFDVITILDFERKESLIDAIIINLFGDSNTLIKRDDGLFDVKIRYTTKDLDEEQLYKHLNTLNISRVASETFNIHKSNRMYVYSDSYGG